jgi:hypothetical protein
MRAHEAMEKSDYPDWVRLLAGWKMDRQAWEVVSRNLDQPPADTQSGTEDPANLKAASAAKAWELAKDGRYDEAVRLVLGTVLK